MNNHPPRVGPLPDTDLRAHDVRLCEQCEKPVRMPGRNWRHCGYECRRIARYRALGKDVPPAKMKQKHQPALPPHREEPEDWIEARMQYWTEYHRRNRTFRIRDGWEGGRSSLLGGDS